MDSLPIEPPGKPLESLWFFPNFYHWWKHHFISVFLLIFLSLVALSVIEKGELKSPVVTMDFFISVSFLHFEFLLLVAYTFIVFLSHVLTILSLFSFPLYFH